VYETEKTITESGLKNSSARMLSPFDIVISARGTVGAIAQLTKAMAFNQSCYGLKNKQESINNYIYYLIKQNIGLLKSIRDSL
jgi:type I restriction enzyme S subunit